MISIVDHRKAFNIITHDSLLIFQCTDKLVPCAAQIKHSDSLSEDVLNAYNTVMDNYPPDNSKHALILGPGDAKEIATEDLGQSIAGRSTEDIAAVLLSEGYCTSVTIVHGEEKFLAKYPFLQNVDFASFPGYSSEITDSLFLGGIANISETALAHQGITAVVSVVQHPVPTIPGITDHIRFCIEDECHADISKHFDDAIEFIKAAHSRNQKVLVHCHQGVSRSASILIAYMVYTGISSGVSDALISIKSQRQQVQPNPAFMTQLYVWEMRHSMQENISK